MRSEEGSVALRETAPALLTDAELAAISGGSGISGDGSLNGASLAPQ